MCPVPEFIPFLSGPAAEIKDHIDAQLQDLCRGVPHQFFNLRVTFVMNGITAVVFEIIAEHGAVPFVLCEPQSVKFVFQPDGFRYFSAARKSHHQMQSRHVYSFVFYGSGQETGKWIVKQVPSPGTDSNDSEPS